MENNDVRDFDLGIVLSITSERLLTDFNNIFDILNYLTVDDVYLHRVPVAIDVTKEYILLQYPELEGIGCDEVLLSEEDAKEFVKKQKEIFGNSIPLSPITDYKKKKYILKK